MLAKRIIPCLDVKNGQVVKGVKFQGHQVVGDILERAQYYAEQGADELVFYEISASVENRLLDVSWVEAIAQVLDIPFCVAGGIKSVDDARAVLRAGADKISVNSQAISRPELIAQLHDEFGKQCVVVGIDSYFDQQSGQYWVKQFTGDPSATRTSPWQTAQWLDKVQALGAGEVVLNCMNQDGVRQGYDLAQLQALRANCDVPLIASGGAGTMQHFAEVFAIADGALAASVFHNNHIAIPELKAFLRQQQIAIRSPYAA